MIFLGFGDQHHLLLCEWWGADSAEESLEEKDDGQEGWEGDEVANASLPTSYCDQTLCISA